MKIKTKKADLLRVLYYANSVADSNSVQPILSNVLLETSEDKLKVSAMNLEHILTTSIDCEVLEDGKICINSKKLFEIINVLPDASIELKTTENYRLIISCENAIYTLYGYSSAEYPDIHQKQLENQLIIDRGVLNTVIDKTSFVAILESEHFFFRGVYFKIENDKITAVSTDGSRLVVISKELNRIDKYKNENVVELVIPKKFLELIKKISDGINDTNVKLYYSEDKILFDYNNIRIISSLLEGKYPDYKKVIPVKLDEVAVLNKDEFVNAIKRVSLMSDDAISKSIILDLNSPDVIELKSADATFGEAVEKVDLIGCTVGKLKLACSGKYLLEFLKSIDSKMIDVMLVDENSPILLEGCTTKNHTCVLMPMRYN